MLQFSGVPDGGPFVTPHPVELLQRAVAGAPDATATIVDRVASLTFAELESRSRRVSLGLMQRGVVPGTRIAVAASETRWIEFVIAAFGIYRAGATLLPLGADAVPDDLQRAARRLHLGAAIFAEADSLAQARLDVACWSVEALERTPLGPLETRVAADQLAYVVLTSASTGPSKAIGVSHANLIAHNPPPFHEWGQPRSRFLITPRIGTAASQTLLHDVVGGPIVLVAPRFDPPRCCELVERHRVTTLGLVPASAAAIVHALRLRPRDVSSVRCVVTSSAPCPPALIEELGVAFPAAEVYNSYGLAEGPQLWNSQRSGRSGSIGRPVDGAEVRVVAGDGHALSKGEVGEIWLRDPQLVAGRVYLGDDGSLKPTADRHGWVRTGDLGYADDDGFVYFVDRKDDLILCSGHNVSSAEVEGALVEHPSVLEAAVVGVPHPVLGQAIVAAVRTEGDVEVSALSAHCAASLPAHKRPQQIARIPALPLNRGGKVDKRALRDRLTLGRGAGATARRSDNGLEDTVLHAWRDALGVADLTPGDSLLEAGARSVLAAHVALGLSEALDAEVPLQTVLECATARDLAVALEELVA
jgi:acyl-CoA synthetase (AMP-forming)/AMP-acid ligase II